MGILLTSEPLCTTQIKNPPKKFREISSNLPNNGKKCLTPSKLPLLKPPRRLSLKPLRKLLKKRPKRLFQPTAPRPKKLRPRTARLRPQKTRTKMAMKTIRKKPIRTLTCPCLQKTVMPKLKPLKTLKKIKKLQLNVKPANLKLRHYQFQLKKS